MSVEGVWHTVLRFLVIEAVLAALLSPAVFAVLAQVQQLPVVEEE
jgi:hypothetical protein